MKFIYSKEFHSSDCSMIILNVAIWSAQDRCCRNPACSSLSVTNKKQESQLMLTNPLDTMLYWVGRYAAELLRIFYFQNGGRPPSWILYFRNVCEKFKFAPISSASCKICWRSVDPRPCYCAFSFSKMVAVINTRMGKIGDYGRKSPFISETVRDSPMVTMEL